MTPLSTKCCADEDISPPNSKCIRDDPDNVDYFVNDVDDLQSLDAEALLEIVQSLEKDKEALQQSKEVLQRHQDHIYELEDKVQHKTMMLDIMTDNVERPEAEVKNHRNECYDTTVSGMECSNKTAACISLMKDEVVELLDYMGFNFISLPWPFKLKPICIMFANYGVIPAYLQFVQFQPLVFACLYEYTMGLQAMINKLELDVEDLMMQKQNDEESYIWYHNQISDLQAAVHCQQEHLLDLTEHARHLEEETMTRR
ncbi:hypothetical protein EDB19DRAFT_1834927 [Suillus lakei]|nr:hypothetical protein EDB19DRAFT_1834927 [Suillus lakei]